MLPHYRGSIFCAFIINKHKNKPPLVRLIFLLCAFGALVKKALTFKFIFCLLLRQIFLICGKNRIFKLLTGGRAYWVNYVAENSALVLAARHGEKKPLRAGNYL